MLVLWSALLSLPLPLTTTEWWNEHMRSCFIVLCNWTVLLHLYRYCRRSCLVMEVAISFLWQRQFTLHWWWCLWMEWNGRHVSHDLVKKLPFFFSLSFLSSLSHFYYITPSWVTKINLTGRCRIVHDFQLTRNICMFHQGLFDTSKHLILMSITFFVHHSLTSQSSQHCILLFVHYVCVSTIWCVFMDEHFFWHLIEVTMPSVTWTTYITQYVMR